MFYGCSSLNKITMLATDINASGCLINWVSGVASSGTATSREMFCFINVASFLANDVGYAYVYCIMADKKPQGINTIPNT